MHEKPGSRRYKEDVPLRYVARDLVDETTGRLQPQHAVWDRRSDLESQVRWVNHSQGDKMAAFDGPDSAWLSLTCGAFEYGLPPKSEGTPDAPLQDGLRLLFLLQRGRNCGYELVGT